MLGVTNNLPTMEVSEVVQKSPHNAARDYYLEKDEARAKIGKFFSICKREGCGQAGSGNLCFSDGTISIQEIEEYLPDANGSLLLSLMPVYSGHWAN